MEQSGRSQVVKTVSEAGVSDPLLPEAPALSALHVLRDGPAQSFIFAVSNLYLVKPGLEILHEYFIREGALWK